MKKNSFLFLVLMSVLTLSWTGCTDSVDYTPTSPLEGQGVYFPSSTVTSYTVDGVAGSIDLNVYRSNSNGAFQAKLNADFNENGKDVFDVPATVDFPEGEDSTSITITYDGITRGTAYELSLSFEDATPYANSSIKLKVLYPSEVSYEWVVLSDKAVYTDNLFSMFGISDFNFKAELDKPIVVEKAKGYNMIRFRSPYDNDFFNAIMGGSLFPDDYELPYIVLDGEKYKAEGKWFIPKTCLGFSISGEGEVQVDPKYQTCGSVAGNLQTKDGPIPPTSKEFPLGTFDQKLQKFDLGTMYHDIVGVGPYPINKSFTLFLDPSLMEPDFDRDFTWNDVEESTGELTSEIAGGEVKLVTLQRAKEDETFYRIPQMYSKSEHLYFNIKDGEVSLPKKQKTGLSTFGNPVFLEGTPGQSSFNPETEVLKLAVTLYLGDENGEKKADLKQGVETFLWGKTALDELELGKDIDDYVGTWGVYTTNGEKEYNFPVTITKTGEKTLSVAGMSGMQNYDDRFELKYEVATGLLKFIPQQTVDIQEGLTSFIALFDKDKSQVNFKGSDKLIGGLTSSKTLKFLNDSENSRKWTNFAYIYTDGKTISLLSGYWNSLEWFVPAQEQSVSNVALAPAFTAIVPWVEDQFTPSLYKGGKLTNGNQLGTFIPSDSHLFN